MKFNFIFLTCILNTISNVLSENPFEQGIYKEICRSKKCLLKCCPDNEFVFIDLTTLTKTCQKPHDTWGRRRDFSEVRIYDEKKHLTEKRLKDIYTLVPGILLNETFNMNSFDYALVLNHNNYLTENSVLFDEVPNSLRRWTKLDRNLFCVDYQLSANNRVGFLTVLELSVPSDPTRNVLYVVGLFVSCVFLALILVVYILLPELRCLSVWIRMAYVASMLAAFLGLAIVQLKAQHYFEVCLTLSYVTYFFLLSAFFWMTIMSYDMWCLYCSHRYRPTNRHSSRSRFRMYCACAWGVPAALTVVVITLNHVNMISVPWFVTPKVSKFGCFIAGDEKLLYLYIPMLILIITNWIFFLMTSYSLWFSYKATNYLDKKADRTETSAVQNSDHRTQKKRFFVYVKLSIIMGINWVLEVASSFAPNLKLWYIFDCFNMLIGLSIFLIFIANKKIYRKLLKKFQKQENTSIVINVQRPESQMSSI